MADFLAGELGTTIERIDALEAIVARATATFTITSAKTPHKGSGADGLRARLAAVRDAARADVAAVAELRDFLVDGAKLGQWPQPPSPQQVVNIAISTIERLGARVERMTDELGEARRSIEARDRVIEEAGQRIADLELKINGGPKL